MIWSVLSRRTWIEWLATTLLLLLVLALLNVQLRTTVIGVGVYDQFMRWQAGGSGKPLQQRGVIVKIDDASLQALGRWPWPRRTHAQLLDTIAAANPQAVALDILLTEEQTDGDGTDDLLLSQAIARAKVPVVLPVDARFVGQTVRFTKPAHLLLKPNVQLAHIRVQPDIDGVVRRVYLREGFAVQAEPYDYLALSLARLAGLKPTAAAQPDPARTQTDPDGLLMREQEHVVRTVTGSSGFVEVSYVDVWEGKVPPEVFAGKIVLVGPTAAALYDAFPLTGDVTSGQTPGVRIVAEVFDNLMSTDRREQAMKAAALWLSLPASIVAVLVMMMALLLLRPVRGLVAIAAMSLAWFCLCYAVFTHAGTWLAPAPVLLVAVLAAPLWNWRRLEAALATVRAESAALAAEPDFLPALRQNAPERAIDMLDARLSALSSASRRVRDLRRFLGEALEQLPDAAWIVDTSQHVLMFNRDAQALAEHYQLAPENVLAVLAHFATVLTEDQEQALDNQRLDWEDVLQAQLPPAFAEGVEARDPNGRSVLVKTAQLDSPERQADGKQILVRRAVVVSVIDLTVIRQLEDQRERALRFLSHDIRAPQASILALLDTNDNSDTPALLRRIRGHANSTLALADAFVQLARAENNESYRFEPLLLNDLAAEALDEVWAQAQSGKVSLSGPDEQAGELWVEADRSLLWRALVNLLTNAIKFSSAQDVVSVRLEARGDKVRIEVRDQGPGIAPEQLGRLFGRFSQLPSDQRKLGVGLGLAFVRAVADRHQGSVHVESELGHGSCFVLTLPLLPPDFVAA